MPKSIYQSDINDETYNEAKGLRLNKTSKQLRRLRKLERVYYKKTFEVKKTGHSLEDEHRLFDGNIRSTTRNLTYSLNKKKRWLLPKILEERICEHSPYAGKERVEKGDQISTVDERLKIVMYENENTRNRANCIRYGNSQTEPHFVYKNGQRFNAETLTSWMNFDTRERRHRRRNNSNAPNFGFQQRPGFFPSEVTYEFTYPKALPSSENRRSAKTSLHYTSSPNDDNWSGRHRRDSNKHQRKVRRFECGTYDTYEEEYDFEEEDEDDIEYIMSLIDENEKWSIVFDDSDEQFLTSADFPIDYFFPSPASNERSSSPHSEIIIDHKANKYFEPPSSTDKQDTKPVTIDEESLPSIPCENESDFLSTMQKSNMNISQANISPPLFLQRTLKSSFSVIYAYSQTSSTVSPTVKFTKLPPSITFDRNRTTLKDLIELVSKKLGEYQTDTIDQSAKTGRIDVDALRGSLPMPTSISQNMLLVKPHSIEKQRALEKENLIPNQQAQGEQWFDTTKTQYEMLECSICCEVLTSNDAYQLLPCHHTLCQTCLTSYIRTSIASATYSSTSISPITCFQPNCPTQLNSALLQAFISYDIYQSYSETLLERQLFSLGYYRKCPSRACSNLLIVGDDTKSSLMCSCGQRVCLKCLEEYHFPATCKQYKSYETRLRLSSDHLLSVSKIGDNSHCYIAEGKNCPNCGEFVEKNGGCPHMTCKCGNEYCWMCLKRWSTHNYSFCNVVPESTHELRSSSRSRFFNKALTHRRQRNQYTFTSLQTILQKSKISSQYYSLILSTYIDLNTLAEFIYVLMQRRRMNGNIRCVLGQTATRLEAEAFHIKVQIESNQIREDHIDRIRSKLERTVFNLLYMKNTKVLL